MSLFIISSKFFDRTRRAGEGKLLSTSLSSLHMFTISEIISPQVHSQERIISEKKLRQALNYLIRVNFCMEMLNL